MTNEIIYSDEYIKMYKLSDGLYIESLKSGMSLNQLHGIITSHPEFQITDFNAIKNALNCAPKPPTKFGTLKERIVITELEDGLKATIIYNLPKTELELKNREHLVKETYDALSKKGVSFGVKREFFFSEIEAGKVYTVAEGTASVDGKDCVIKMYEINEPKPEIKEDGKANFYELKLINKVKAGDWLGERIEATEGFPGRTVTGNTILAVKGKNFPLLYDKNTVYEVLQNGKTLLYSKIDGAVSYSDGKISVSNHLEIDGNVDFKTGNIKFDGYVTINGTVTDGFFVEATKDIEINSPLGLGNVKGITSTEGSIFIKGGIASKGQVEIKAKKHIFTKFVDNAVMTCGGTAHIGFYCINSTIDAKEVFIESIKGNIIGGNVTAEIKVTSPVIGSPLEVRTVVEVKGFNREALTEQLESVIARIGKLKDDQQKFKLELSKSDAQKEMTPTEVKAYNNNFLKLAEVKEAIKTLEDEKKNLTRYLKTKGEGEISIAKKVFPNCILIVKNIQTEIRSPSVATTLFFIDGELRQI